MVVEGHGGRPAKGILMKGGRRPLYRSHFVGGGQFFAQIMGRTDVPIVRVNRQKTLKSNLNFLFFPICQIKI